MGFDLPWFPIYAAEMLADGRFQGWNLEERGAWLTLLAYNWNDGDLPAGHSELARLLHVGPGDMARIWSAIGSRFCDVPGSPGRVWCERLEEERDKARQLSNKRAESGRKGATARWGQSQDDGNRMPLPSQQHGNRIANGCPLPSPSPVPSPKKKEASGERSASPPSPPTTPVGLWLSETWPDITDPDGFAKTQADANPGIDLLSEARKAKAWEVANPDRRKRRHGPFLSRWFARAQDDLGGKRNGAAAKPRVISGISDFSDEAASRAWDPTKARHDA